MPAQPTAFLRIAGIAVPCHRQCVQTPIPNWCYWSGYRVARPARRYRSASRYRCGAIARPIPCTTDTAFARDHHRLLEALIERLAWIALRVIEMKLGRVCHGRCQTVKFIAAMRAQYLQSVFTARRTEHIHAKAGNCIGNNRAWLMVLGFYSSLGTHEFHRSLTVFAKSTPKCGSPAKPKSDSAIWQCWFCGAAIAAVCSAAPKSPLYFMIF